MNVNVSVDPGAATKEGFAVVSLQSGGQLLGQLDVEFSHLASLQAGNPRALDLLLLASVVYAIDKLVPRDTAADWWTREFSVRLPVSDPSLWSSAAPELVKSLSFLTGDLWAVDFVQLRTPLVRLSRRGRRRRMSAPHGDVVSLFSGGLDSLIGVIDHLEAYPNKKILLVGHHDGQMAGPLSDQQGILKQLLSLYPQRVEAFLVRVGHTSSAREITLRSRSLLFIALGVYAASALMPDTQLLIPENGTIALNAPLTPSRRGSCSTRTAHPYYLSSLQRVLHAVGLGTTLVNPLESKTKGEAVAQCRNLNVLRKLTPLSVSCAKRGHKRSWLKRSAKSCGRCMPCIYRRAALHSIGMDIEIYGVDICKGEVDISDHEKEAPNDLRACFFFLKRNASPDEIAKMLIASGSLEPSRLAAYARLVYRAMDEIRALLRDKANLKIKKYAGV
jgi:hypothetical protein